MPRFSATLLLALLPHAIASAYGGDLLLYKYLMQGGEHRHVHLPDANVCYNLQQGCEELEFQSAAWRVLEYNHDKAEAVIELYDAADCAGEATDFSVFSYSSTKPIDKLEYSNVDPQDDDSMKSSSSERFGGCNDSMISNFQSDFAEFTTKRRVRSVMHRISSTNASTSVKNASQDVICDDALFPTVVSGCMALYPVQIGNEAVQKMNASTDLHASVAFTRNDGQVHRSNVTASQVCYDLGQMKDVVSINASGLPPFGVFRNRGSVLAIYNVAGCKDSARWMLGIANTPSALQKGSVVAEKAFDSIQSFMVWQVSDQATKIVSVEDNQDNGTMADHAPASKTNAGCAFAYGHLTSFLLIAAVIGIQSR